MIVKWDVQVIFFPALVGVILITSFLKYFGRDQQV